MNNLVNSTLTEKIIGCCFMVHTELGPGFKEQIYSNALQITLKKHLINFSAEKYFVLKFEENIIGRFRCDLLVEETIILELKSVNGLMPKLFYNQLLSYLKASKLKTGLLINFGNTSCEVKRLSL